MTAFLIMIAAIASADARPAPAFRPTAVASARATASVRVISGVSFGPGRPDKVAGAAVRKTQLTDAQGQIRPANLLEFQ